MTPRPYDRFPVAAIVLAVVIGAGAGVGTTIALTPDPKLVIRTETVAVPPACIEAIEAARSERAHTATAQEHDTLAAQASAERYDAELTRDDDTIRDAARALDAELRLVQEADLAAAEAASAFDTAAGKCLPERES